MAESKLRTLSIFQEFDNVCSRIRVMLIKSINTAKEGEK